MSVEKRRPPLTTIFLWIVGVLTLVLTGYGIFTGVVLALPFPYNILMVINSTMVGIIEIFVGALIDMHSKRARIERIESLEDGAGGCFQTQTRFCESQMRFANR